MPAPVVNASPLIFLSKGDRIEQLRQKGMYLSEEVIDDALALVSE